MIRALYTAATGMNAQQANIDNVAHNLANVNTTGFKKSRMEFEDLVYQQITVPGSATSTSAEAPIGLEIGLGTRAGRHRARLLRPATCKATNGPLDLAIEGAGFFQITLPNGDTGYTRAGSFHLDARGHARHVRGLSARAGRSRFPPTRRRSDLEGRHRLACRSPARPRRSSSARIELATFQNPGRPAGARRQPVRRRRPRLGRRRRPARPAPKASARCAGLPRGLERQRRRGDGQHDPRPARLRGELAVVKAADEMLLAGQQPGRGSAGLAAGADR